MHTSEEKYKYKEMLHTAILNEKIIPTKFLYWTHDGCRLWLDMCKDPQYIFHVNSLAYLQKNINEVTGLIRNLAGSDIDFISLGCGDGRKDETILKHLMKNLNEGQSLYYYPIDISEAMLVEAIRTVNILKIKRDKLKIKAIIGDVAALSTYKKVFEFRPNPNVFSILGNTLGNNSENEIFDALNHSMFLDDLLLVEVSVSLDISLHNELFKTYEGKVIISHRYTPQGSIPLVALKIPCESDYDNIIRYSIEEDASFIPKTKTLAAYVDKIAIDENEFSDVRLSCVHFYDLENFKTTMEKN